MERNLKITTLNGANKTNNTFSRAFPVIWIANPGALSHKNISVLRLCFSPK